MGALNSIRGINDAPAEESEYAPSIASVETNIDEASASVMSKANNIMMESTMTGARNNASSASKGKYNLSGEPEVVAAPETKELIFASPIKALQKAAAMKRKQRRKIEGNEKTKRKEERRAICERKRIEEEMRKANESLVQKALSPKAYHSVSELDRFNKLQRRKFSIPPNNRKS